MRARWLFVLTLVSTVLLSASASASPPALALFSGFVLPDSRSESDDEGSHNFGFFVDLPMVSTFYVSPVAELYKVRGSNVTDLMKETLSSVSGLRAFHFNGGILLRF